MMFDNVPERLGITLPEPVETVYNYKPLMVHGGIAYLAGQIPKLNTSNLRRTGRVGAKVNVADAGDDARLCVLHGLSWLRHELGTLNRIEQVLRIVGYVSTTRKFKDISRVIEPASDLLVEIFGDAGIHSRSVVGVSRLPRNAPVMVEMTIALKT